MPKKFWPCLFRLFGLSPNSAEVQSGGWTQLFNAKDLTGWKHVGHGKDIVEDGLIRRSGGSGVLYWGEGKFGDCTIRVMYRMRHHNDNSGVFICMQDVPTVDHGHPVHGGPEGSA